MLVELPVCETRRGTMRGVMWQREGDELSYKEGASAGKGPCVPEWVETLGLNILHARSWSRASCDFYFVLNISRCDGISSCHVYKPVSRNRRIFVFVEHKAVQEVILACVALETNGSTGSFWGRFSTIGHFTCSNIMAPVLGLTRVQDKSM